LVAVGTGFKMATLQETNISLLRKRKKNIFKIAFQRDMLISSLEVKQLLCEEQLVVIIIASF